MSNRHAAITAHLQLAFVVLTEARDFRHLPLYLRLSTKRIITSSLDDMASLVLLSRIWQSAANIITTTKHAITSLILIISHQNIIIIFFIVGVLAPQRAFAVLRPLV